VIPQHVYLHVPFCARRCVYCDFAIAVRRNVPVTDFAESVRREIEIRFPDLPKSEVRTIYLGGGTPSRLGGEGIAQVLETLAARWVPGAGAEVTIEANPEDVTPEAARVWQAAGVTRVSLGVQSFSPVVLTWMHRTHDVPAVARAVAALRDAGIAQLSVDLIFALPDVVERDWDYDLEQAILLAPDHVSCYGLTFEDGTPLARTRLRGTTHEADDTRYAAEFMRADAMLTSAGFEHYEVSNYAKPGARAVHNSAYWNHVPYAGLGPSAHEFIDGVRRWNVREYTAWVGAVAASRDPRAGSEELNADQRSLEALFLGLRTITGAARDVRDAEIVRKWEEAGWARLSSERVQLTPQGWLRMNALVAALTQRRSRY
jgi:oxygen-independent coproporphyrinogen-3 oxidase